LSTTLFIFQQLMPIPLTECDESITNTAQINISQLENKAWWT